MLPGDARFADAADFCTFACEEATTRFTEVNDYLPHLSRAFLGRSDLRLLSAGCGVGADVDAFRAAGIAPWGVDCGARTKASTGQADRWAFQIGSVLQLQRTDASFDAVVTGCLLPHIGVEGDSTRTLPDCAAHRQAAADELMRVLVAALEAWLPPCRCRSSGRFSPRSSSLG